MSRSPALSPTRTVGRAAPRFPLLYRTLRAGVRAALLRWFDLRVEGLQHLPPDGPYIVAANPSHFSRRGGARPRPAGANRFHRHAACVAGAPTPSAVSPHIGSIPI